MECDSTPISPERVQQSSRLCNGYEQFCNLYAGDCIDFKEPVYSLHTSLTGFSLPHMQKLPRDKAYACSVGGISLLFFFFCLVRQFSSRNNKATSVFLLITFVHLVDAFIHANTMSCRPNTNVNFFL